MTNLKHKCPTSHSMNDLYYLDDESGTIKEFSKWHTCQNCGKYKTTDWIRRHEVYCPKK